MSSPTAPQAAASGELAQSWLDKSPADPHVTADFLNRRASAEIARRTGVDVDVLALASSPKAAERWLDAERERRRPRTCKERCMFATGVSLIVLVNLILLALLLATLATFVSSAILPWRLFASASEAPPATNATTPVPTGTPQPSGFAETPVPTPGSQAGTIVWAVGSALFGISNLLLLIVFALLIRQLKQTIAAQAAAEEESGVGLGGAMKTLRDKSGLKGTSAASSQTLKQQALRLASSGATAPQRAVMTVAVEAEALVAAHRESSLDPTMKRRFFWWLVWLILHLIASIAWLALGRTFGLYDDPDHAEVAKATLGIQAAAVGLLGLAIVALALKPCIERRLEAARERGDAARRQRGLTDATAAQKWGSDVLAAAASSHPEALGVARALGAGDATGAVSRSLQFADATGAERTTLLSVAARALTPPPETSGVVVSEEVAAATGASPSFRAVVPVDVLAYQASMADKARRRYRLPPYNDEEPAASGGAVMMSPTLLSRRPAPSPQQSL